MRESGAIFAAVLMTLVLAESHPASAASGGSSVEKHGYLLEAPIKKLADTGLDGLPITITNLETGQTHELTLDWYIVRIEQLHLSPVYAVIVGGLVNQAGYKIIVASLSDGQIVKEQRASSVSVSSAVDVVFFAGWYPRSTPPYVYWPNYHVLVLNDPDLPSYPVHPLEPEPPLEYDPFDNPPEGLWRHVHAILTEEPAWTPDGKGLLFLSKHGTLRWSKPYTLSLVAIDYSEGFAPLDRVVHTFDHTAWFVEEAYLKHWDSERAEERVVFPVKAIRWIDEHEAEMTLSTGSFFYWEYDTYRIRWDREAGTLELFPVDSDTKDAG